MSATFKQAPINVRERLNELECTEENNIVSDISLVTNSNQIKNIVSMTQADYDLLLNPSDTTLYVIQG